eukprot:5054381-Pyramimonas_sp.AAC.1
MARAWPGGRGGRRRAPPRRRRRRRRNKKMRWVRHPSSGVDALSRLTLIPGMHVRSGAVDTMMKHTDGNRCRRRPPPPPLTHALLFRHLGQWTRW